MDNSESVTFVVFDQIWYILKKQDLRLVFFGQDANVVEKRPSCLIFESFLGSRFAERLTREASTDDVHFGNVIEYIPDVAVDIKATWLAPISFVCLCRMLVNVGCKNALMTESVEGGVEAADATKQVNKAHENDLVATVNKDDVEGPRWN